MLLRCCFLDIDMICRDILYIGVQAFVKVYLYDLFLLLFIIFHLFCLLISFFQFQLDVAYKSVAYKNSV